MEDTRLPCPFWQIPCDDVASCQFRVKTFEMQQNVLGQTKQVENRECLFHAMAKIMSQQTSTLNTIMGVLQQLANPRSHSIPFTKG